MIGKYKFAIDRGGTFTDIFAICPDGSVKTTKVLSENSQSYRDGPCEGIIKILKEECADALDANGKINSKHIEWIRMGTTVATNALLERKGVPFAFVTNEGLRDILVIGNQDRPKIFDLDIVRPENLYVTSVGVNCRVIPVETHKCKDIKDDFEHQWRTVRGQFGDIFYVTEEFIKTDVEKTLSHLRAQNIANIAVALPHSYAYQDQELEIAHIANEMGFKYISLSHKVMPMVRLVNRAFTSCIDAYLTPHIQNYMSNFADGFSDGLKNTRVLFMKSDGGLTSLKYFTGCNSILSGPAGGVVGYAQTTYTQENNCAPVIGFDMGGTSTDVSRYAGSYEYVFETTTAGVMIQAPQVDISTVAAGGGSRLFFRSNLFVVGPESSGAHPGPVCYRKAGHLSLTDANVVLGRIVPGQFPCIFGFNANDPLDKEAAVEAMNQMTAHINKLLGKNMSIEEVALGFVKVANETMCRSIREITQSRGYDSAQHVLACFGGAGGQHACSIAKSLGIQTIFIHKYAGILSAYGMALADYVHEIQEPSSKIYCRENFLHFIERINELSALCTQELKAQGFCDVEISLEPFLNLRYDGTDCSIMCKPSAPNKSFKFEDFLDSFLSKYESEYGFSIKNRDIIVDDIRLRASGKFKVEDEKNLELVSYAAKVAEKTLIFFDDGYMETNIYLLKDLRYGHTLHGPALIVDNFTTILVEPGFEATITSKGHIKMQLIKMSSAPQTLAESLQMDTIQLSIFSHRFMSIAEQMGRVLQRTSTSTNIKERLDFSCAVFGPDGGLVSNAPHIPVHLGSMQEAVRFQIQHNNNSFKVGDVILTNHPVAGGSHLPDLTVITPVFHECGTKPIFFVANRGHHADIGGLTPGSMPSHSQRLDEEGAAFISFKIVEKNEFQETALCAAFKAANARNISDNLSDLKAQIAANKKGAHLVHELINEYGLVMVHAYMEFIQQNAEQAVRQMLQKVAQNTIARTGSSTLQAMDYMDDGSPICIRIFLDSVHGSAVFDFTGTGTEVLGNCNAPKAITFSAVIYCLRCMISHDIPLNQGCLTPIRIILPTGSILNPSAKAAVVGGNVLTSQRIVDVIFGAFEVCAASQGCMNNLSFGSETWGFYETIAGGSGAGPTWHGSSGVHTHMTNTRITDVEILEKNFPVYVKKFHIRNESGGLGMYRGGDGLLRELMFRSCVTLSILSERRAIPPYGLKGGQDGKRGINLLKRRDGITINLGAKPQVKLQAGEVLQIFTPGGGGYGQLTEN